MSSPATVLVVGAGTVGRHLAVAVNRAGHPVRFALRDPAGRSAREATDAVPGAEVVPLADAGQAGDLVVLAVPYRAVTDAVTALGPIPGVLVDATNAVRATLPQDCASVLDVIAGALGDAGPQGGLVKAFNTIGAEAFVDPVFEGRAAFLPVAGDEPGATRVAELAQAIGFDAQLIGGRDQAPLLEGFAALWIRLALGLGEGRGFGFARVTRTGGSRGGR